MEISGKVFIVTGAASGLGEGTARMLVANGAKVVLADLQDARAAFSRIAADIGMQYSLGYYPTNKSRDGKFRRIRVELNGLSGKNEVRAREGYNAPKK